jgi:conjugative transfer signal peptidase TraF
MKTGLLPLLRKSIRTGKRLAAIALGLLCLVFIIPAVAGIRINESPSLPIGLYMINESRGHLVEFCPPEPFAALAIERGYRGAGNCPDGGAPLMKPEIARTGDIVELNPSGVTVNGKLLPNSAPLQFDTQGRSLDHWRFGRSKVGQGEIWVISSFNARSFDSRYLGPITSCRIRHHLLPVLTLQEPTLQFAFSLK